MSRGAVLEMKSSHVMVDDVTAKRIRALCYERGTTRAKHLLGVSDATFETARESGKVMAKTRDRIVAALDRIESEAKGEAHGDGS